MNGELRAKIENIFDLAFFGSITFAVMALAVVVTFSDLTIVDLAGDSTRHTPEAFLTVCIAWATLVLIGWIKIVWLICLLIVRFQQSNRPV